MLAMFTGLLLFMLKVALTLWCVPRFLAKLWSLFLQYWNIAK